LGERRRELGARLHVLDAGDARGLGARHERRPLGPLGPLVARQHEERRALRLAVDHEDRARDLDAGQVEELVVLAELVVRGQLRRSDHDGRAVADLLHHTRAARGELLERERVGEERLRAGDGSDKQHAQCEQ
jgi:hypothetical protein